jgi:hypothetical protein
MKKLILQLVYFLTSAACSAQCIIDSSQTAPGIYPATPPHPQVGVYYSQDFTIVFPTEVSGLAIQSIQVDTITGGIPGMTWTCNSPFPNCTYYPGQSIYGCINISGTPLTSGLFTATINLLVDVQLIGVQHVSTIQSTEVEPGIINNTGFQVTPSSGCAPAGVTITSNTPGQFSYFWNFGNGDTSLLENPGTVNYNTGGTYIIYRDIIPQPGHKYFLTGITVNSVPDAYSDGLFDVADLYIKVKDTNNVNLVAKSIVNNQVSNVSFAVDTLFLNNENYTVEVWDDDPLFGAPDDSLGVISFYGWGTSGNATATLTGASGILDVNYNIITRGVNPVIDSMIVHIYNPPAVPVITSAPDSLYTLAIPGLHYQWYLDSQLLPGDTLPSVTPGLTGDYTLTVTDSNGCTATSLPYLFVSIDKRSPLAFQIYPNPSAGILKINAATSTSCSIVISDAQGRQLYEKSRSALPIRLDLSFFENGIYFLNVETKEGKSNFPIYIVH